MQRGMYHPLTRSETYYVDGMLASTYLDYVPRPMWTVFATWYATSRYHLGMPIRPKTGNACTIDLALDAYDAAGVSPALQRNVLWPVSILAALWVEAKCSIAYA